MNSRGCGHYPMCRALLYLFILVALSLGCSGPDGNRSDESPSEVPESCGNAHAAGARLLANNEPERALDRLRRAIELCRDVQPTFSLVLAQISDIVKLRPDKCPLALELFGLAGSADDVGQLRSLTRAHHVCSGPDVREMQLDRLARRLTNEIYGARGGDMETFVRESEIAQLQAWAGSDAELVQALRNATRELCTSDANLAAMVEALGRSAIGNNNPASILGLWTLAPSDGLDPDSRRCLSRVADEIGLHASEFSTDVAADAVQWSAWFRGMSTE